MLLVSVRKDSSDMFLVLYIQQKSVYSHKRRMQFDKASQNHIRNQSNHQQLHPADIM